jgi:hypothetical protein
MVDVYMAVNRECGRAQFSFTRLENDSDVDPKTQNIEADFDAL